MTYLLLVADGIAGVLLVLLLIKRSLPLIKINDLTLSGLWVGAIGLMAQSLREFSILFFGHFPFDDLPIWILKDAGYWFIAAGLIFHFFSSHKLKN